MGTELPLASGGAYRQQKLDVQLPSEPASYLGSGHVLSLIDTTQASCLVSYLDESRTDAGP